MKKSKLIIAAIIFVVLVAYVIVSACLLFGRKPHVVEGVGTVVQLPADVSHPQYDLDCGRPEGFIDTWDYSESGDRSVIGFYYEDPANEGYYTLYIGGKGTVHKNFMFIGKYDREVTSVVVEDGITSLGYRAFYGCASLKEINIPESVTSIGEYAFANCSSLENIKLPESITSIGNGAFSACTSLTGLSIPASVTEIDKGAFVQCASISDINVDKNNPAYASNGNCLIEKATKTLVKGFNNSVIPTDGSVTAIGREAFNGCDQLASVSIPESVTVIGERAFGGCRALTDVVIPNSVTSIEGKAFFCCSGLKSVTISAGVKSIGGGAFENCTSLVDIRFAGSKQQWENVEKGEKWYFMIPADWKMSYAK